MPLNLLNPANIFAPFAWQYQSHEEDGCLCFDVDSDMAVSFNIATCTCDAGNKMKKLFVDSDTDINVTNLTDESTGDYVENATITWSIEDQYGTAVSGASGTCSHVEDGDYLGQVPSTVDLSAGTVYTLVITISGGTHDAVSRTPVIGCYKT